MMNSAKTITCLMLLAAAAWAAGLGLGSAMAALGQTAVAPAAGASASAAPVAPAGSVAEEKADQTARSAVATPETSESPKPAETAKPTKALGAANFPSAAKTKELVERNALAIAGHYLVAVATRWQKDQGESPYQNLAEMAGGPALYAERVDVESKVSSETLGLVLDPATGLILAQDYCAEPRFVESVKGITADGVEFPLRFRGFCLDIDAAIYKTDKWPGTKTPLAWELDRQADPLAAMYLATLARARQGWDLQLASAGGAGGLTVASDRPTPDELLMETKTGGLAFDKAGRPMGFILDQQVSLSGERFPWRGADLLAAKVMTLEDFNKLRDDRQQRFNRFTHEVKIVYRQPEENEETLQFEGEDRSSLTQYYYGYAVSPKRIFIPVKLDKIYIQRFKKITVQLEDREVEAEFQGAYLNFGGFLVELAGDAVSPGVLPQEAAPLPEVNRAMLTYLAERHFGHRRDTLWYNRLSGYTRGYQDRLWPQPANYMKRGTLALTFDEKPLGLCLIERRPEEEKKGEHGRYSRGNDEEFQLYRMAELADAFKNPQMHFDPNLKPATEREEKRVVWLGVETQPVSPLLAEMLDDQLGSDQTQKLTRNGQVGLRITYVYKGSPAEKAELAPGDILLELREDGKAEPIELKNEGERGGGDEAFFSFSQRGRGGSRMGLASPSHNGYLTGMLTRLGPGAKVTLVYLRGTVKNTQNFTLELAPYDAASANKFKDEKTGLTVKDLTYDMRAFLRLSDDQPGVVVSKVEEGQKAAVAQVYPGLIITEINGRALKNVGDYEQAMTALQKAGAGTAVLKLLWMGKSRIIRIEFP
jgi:hypothetical protein